jgi:hypothetical protein
MLVGLSSPSITTSAFMLGSLNVGPSEKGSALVY